MAKGCQRTVKIKRNNYRTATSTATATTVGYSTVYADICKAGKT